MIDEESLLRALEPGFPGPDADLPTRILAPGQLDLYTIERVLAELSGNTGELLDAVASAIRGDGSDLCDTPWETLSDERKIGWRGDAERAILAVKDFLTTRAAAIRALAKGPDQK